jgi:magnesium transporter
MPELDSKYGYYIIWAVMIATVLGMVSYFRKKKWF